MTKKRQIVFSLVRGALAIFIALMVAAVLIFIGQTLADKFALTGNALKQLLIGPLFKTNSAGEVGAFQLKRLTDVLASMIPTIFTALSVCVMFSANQFNLGAEGGCMLGGFVGGMIAIYVPMAAGLHPAVCILCGGIATALIILIPSVLNAWLGVSEMVCSLMLNYIIMYVIKFLMNTFLADKTKGQVQSYAFSETAKLPQLIDNGSMLSVGFLIAIAAVLLMGVFMFRTRWGYAIRMIGINQDFAMYSGMDVAGIIILSQVIGGFLAGMGGSIEVLGRFSYYNWTSLPGYGWTGVTIAILAGNNPLYVPLASFFMAYLTKGCALMSTYAEVPAQLIDIVQGVIFLFFAAEQFLAKYRQKLVVRTAQEELARKVAAGQEGGAVNA